MWSPGCPTAQSDQVASETADLGHRRAMGASRGRIVGAELMQAMRLLPPGLLLGLAGGWTAVQLIGDRLYKAGLGDPELGLGTAAAIALTIALAGLLPALRASRIEPLQALRHE